MVPTKTNTKTACPKCTKPFARYRGLLGIDGESARARKSAKQKAIAAERLFRNAGVYRPNPVHFDIIRGDQVPNSSSEAAFKAKAVEKGWKPHRPSWPDFLVETDNGLIAVEVKSESDSVKAEQAATFTLLEKMGIPVYVWKNVPGRNTRLERWRENKAEVLLICEAG